MPETSRLLLHSPAGSDVAVYKWPLHVSESWNEPHEIVETIRWVCNDFPELKLAVENYVLNNFDPTSFESMKSLCEKYNRAVDNIRKLWSGRQPPPCIDAPPSLHLLKHVLTQVYNRAITKPGELNNYEPFSPEVYGETSFELISSVISATNMSENDVFLDLGSGVGQIVLQVAASVGCKSIGIEKAETPAKYAEEMQRQFVKWMDFYGKSYGDFELLKGDFLDPKFEEIFQTATVIFCNNFAFGPSLNHKLKLKFQNLRDGVKIVSSQEFCPINFRLTERNLSDIGAMMRVAELSPLKGSVSWTSKPVSYYLHRIDRTKMEEFFHKQKHPDDRSEGFTTSYSEGESSSSSSDSSSSEDSSLDSSDDESLFRKPSEEIHHFPPAFSPSKPSFSSTNYYHPPPPLEQPHPQKKLTLPNNVTSSAIQKKVTPPSGTTHLPRPHPQSIISEKPFLGKSRTQQGSTSTQRLVAKHRKKVTPQQQQAKTGGTSVRGRTSRNIPDMARLFESFQGQVSAYMGQMNDPQYQSWLMDSIEKEKMKRKHLQGVIEHLESEVSTLSLEAINNMKESMTSLGITNLTPEGLLLGAKDIVALNRQLRKEVQILERDVHRLKDENDMINTLCKKVEVSMPTEPCKKATPTSSVAEETSGVHEPSVAKNPLPSVLSKQAVDTSLMTPIGPVAKMTPLMMATPPLSCVKIERVEVATAQCERTTSEEEARMKNTADTSCLYGSSVSHSEIRPTCTWLTVGEEYPAARELNELDKFQISLETIDQAVLELGPFAKEAVTDRPDLPPLSWPHPHSQMELHVKKERKKPYSPPSKVVRKGRTSVDAMSPLSSVGSPMGVEPVVKYPSQRRNNKKKNPSEVESSPLLVGTSESYESTTPVFVGASGTEQKANSLKFPVSSQETSVAEAMLALSTLQQQPSEEQPPSPPPPPPTSLTSEPHCPMPTSSGPVLSERKQELPTLFSPVAPPPMASLHKTSYPLPPLNKLYETPSNKRRSATPTNSNLRSSNESRASYSPSPVSRPPSLTAPPTLKSSADGCKGSSNITSQSVEDVKPTSNPFWPVSTSDTPPSSFSYPLMTWNTMGGIGGLHPAYLSSYSSLARPPSVDPTQPVDLTVPSSFQSALLSPYYFYNHTYPFAAAAAAAGLATPLTNQLLTSSVATVQPPAISSPTPGHHLSTTYKAALSNPYLTPPTLHSLNDAIKVPSNDVLQSSSPFMMLGGAQFPQAQGFINTNQFPGLGMAATPQLSLISGLQPSVGSGLLIGSSTDLGTRDQKKKHNSETTSRDTATPTILYPSRDDLRHYPSSLDVVDSTSSIAGGGRKVLHLPQFIGSSVDVTGNKGERTDKRKKLKIHQMNRDDFNKTSDKSTSDKRRKMVVEQEIVLPTAPPFHNTPATSLRSELSEYNSIQQPPSYCKGDSSSVTGVPMAPPPIDTRVPTLVTMPSTDENEPIIKVDDDDDEMSSEGTVSASPSPQITPTTTKSPKEAISQEKPQLSQPVFEHIQTTPIESDVPPEEEPSTVDQSEVVEAEKGTVEEENTDSMMAEKEEEQSKETINKGSTDEEEHAPDDHQEGMVDDACQQPLANDTLTSDSCNDSHSAQMTEASIVDPGTSESSDHVTSQVTTTPPTMLIGDVTVDTKIVDFKDQPTLTPPPSGQQEKKRVSVDGLVGTEDDILDIDGTSMDYDEFNAEENEKSAENAEMTSEETRHHSPTAGDEPSHRDVVPVLKSPENQKIAPPTVTMGNELPINEPKQVKERAHYKGDNTCSSKPKNAIKMSSKHVTLTSSESHLIDSDRLSTNRKPHPPDHRNGEKYSARRESKKPTEERRSLTPGRQVFRTSPSPSNTIRSRYPYSGDESPPTYNSTHHDTGHRKKHSHHGNSPERHHHSLKIHRERSGKLEEMGHYDKHHKRSHSLTPLQDRVSPYHEESRGGSGHKHFRDDPYWAGGGNNHLFKGRSSYTPPSSDDQVDSVRQARKRHGDPVGEGDITKRHKLKRPKGSPSRYHHHHHHHHHRHAQH